MTILDNQQLSSIKDQKEQELKELIHGSIEIRMRNTRRYLYIHYRDKDKVISKYVGEYSDSLYHEILNNNKQAKVLKKEINDLNKQITNYFHKETLSESVKNNINYLNDNLIDIISNQLSMENINVTNTNIKKIINNGLINNMMVNDILRVINYYNTWKFVLSDNIVTINDDYNLLKDICHILDNTSIHMSNSLIEELDEIINSIYKDIDIAINVILFLIKNRIINNINVALIFVNHFLINHSKGYIIIPKNKINNFNKLIDKYLIDEDDELLSDFINKYCYYK